MPFNNTVAAVHNTCTVNLLTVCGRALQGCHSSTCGVIWTLLVCLIDDKNMFYVFYTSLKTCFLMFFLFFKYFLCFFNLMSCFCCF